MDRPTARLYEDHAAEWIAARSPQAIEDGRFAEFLSALPPRGIVADLGCGPGWYASRLHELGHCAIALDVSRRMLAAAPPQLSRVCADLAALPLRRGALSAAWAINCYSHLGSAELPLALASLHAALAADAPVELTLYNLEKVSAPVAPELDEVEVRADKPPFSGRLFTAVTARRASELMQGAGFGDVSVSPLADSVWLSVRARRQRTLPDFIRPGLRLLVCGLNPSLYSADAGVPFARPGNRFWRAAAAAGLPVRDRDPWATVSQGLGFVDLVKRASASASALSRDEYVNGLQRLQSLVRRYQPQAVCLVGLEGWRAAADRTAQPGWITGGIAGAKAYLMPSTSGRNAHTSLDALAAHLRRAAE